MLSRAHLRMSLKETKSRLSYLSFVLVISVTSFTTLSGHAKTSQMLCKFTLLTSSAVKAVGNMFKKMSGNETYKPAIGQLNKLSLLTGKETLELEDVQALFEHNKNLRNLSKSLFYSYIKSPQPGALLDIIIDASPNLNKEVQTPEDFQYTLDRPHIFGMFETFQNEMGITISAESQMAKLVEERLLYKAMIKEFQKYASNNPKDPRLINAYFSLRSLALDYLIEEYSGFYASYSNFPEILQNQIKHDYIAGIISSTYRNEPTRNVVRDLDFEKLLGVPVVTSSLDSAARLKTYIELEKRKNPVSEKLLEKTKTSVRSTIDFLMFTDSLRSNELGIKFEKVEVLQYTMLEYLSLSLGVEPSVFKKLSTNELNDLAKDLQDQIFSLILDNIKTADPKVQGEILSYLIKLNNRNNFDGKPNLAWLSEKNQHKLYDKMISSLVDTKSVETAQNLFYIFDNQTRYNLEDSLHDRFRIALSSFVRSLDERGKIDFALREVLISYRDKGDGANSNTLSSLSDISFDADTLAKVEIKKLLDDVYKVFDDSIVFKSTYSRSDFFNLTPTTHALLVKVNQLGAIPTGKLKDSDIEDLFSVLLNRREFFKDFLKKDYVPVESDPYTISDVIEEYIEYKIYGQIDLIYSKKEFGLMTKVEKMVAGYARLYNLNIKRWVYAFDRSPLDRALRHFYKLQLATGLRDIVVEERDFEALAKLFGPKSYLKKSSSSSNLHSVLKTVD